MHSYANVCIVCIDTTSGRTTPPGDIIQNFITAIIALRKEYPNPIQINQNPQNGPSIQAP